MPASRLAAGGLVVCLALLGTGCSQPAAKPLRGCGIIVDATSFSGHTDVPGKIKSKVPKFLAECDRVAFGVISGSAGSSDCREEPMELVAGPQDNPQNNPNKATQIGLLRRAAAVTTMNRLLDCALAETDTRTGSDIIGALSEIARQTAPFDKAAKVLVISDMAQNTKELSLYKAEIDTPEKRLAIISVLQQTNRLPRLNGTHIKIIGFGIDVTKQVVRDQQIRDFWDLLFQKAGAHPATYV
ncbi:hypothetical protein [Sphaerisporangium aureirubrum]|uniref:VWA domain-containing protein n=1 Tax=Sphaerisporangium aureirubrum TaxID=1544736 RepID=A0ABW1NFB6_9ACTN